MVNGINLLVNGIVLFTNDSNRFINAHDLANSCLRAAAATQTQPPPQPRGSGQPPQFLVSRFMQLINRLMLPVSRFLLSIEVMVML